MLEFIVVYVTAGSAQEADPAGAGAGGRKARGLRPTASKSYSVRCIAGKGRSSKTKKELLIIKTRKELFPALERECASCAAILVPEIIAVPLVAGSAGYLGWLQEQLAVNAPPKETTPRTIREFSAGGSHLSEKRRRCEVALIHVRNRWGLPKGHVGRRGAGQKKPRCVRSARKPAWKENSFASSAISGYSYRDKNKGARAGAHLQAGALLLIAPYPRRCARPRRTRRTTRAGFRSNKRSSSSSLPPGAKRYIAPGPVLTARQRQQRPPPRGARQYRERKGLFNSLISCYPTFVPRRPV